MRPPPIRHWPVTTAVVFLFLALGVYGFGFTNIYKAVTNAAASAMAQYPGDRVDALIALVDCEYCSLNDRNRAVWALGQLRDPRALPALERRYTGAPCNYPVDLCQYELRKAIKAIRSRSALWSGYRDLPKI